MRELEKERKENENLKRLLSESNEYKNSAADENSFIGRLNSTNSPTSNVKEFLKASNGVNYVLENGNFYAVNFKQNGNFTKHDFRSIETNIRTNQSKLNRNEGNPKTVRATLQKWKSFRTALVELV